MVSKNVLKVITFTVGDCNLSGLAGLCRTLHNMPDEWGPVWHRHVEIFCCDVIINFIQYFKVPCCAPDICFDLCYQFPAGSRYRTQFLQATLGAWELERSVKVCFKKGSKVAPFQPFFHRGTHPRYFSGLQEPLLKPIDQRIVRRMFLTMRVNGRNAPYINTP